MKLTQVATVFAAALFCTAAFAGGPAWNPIAVAPTVNNYYQQQPDYAANVSRGFSKLEDLFREYVARQPMNKKYAFPDESHGVMVDDTTMFVTAVDGTQFICAFENGKRRDCNRSR